MDCNGVCGGDSVPDACNNCDGPGCSDENGVAAPCGEIPLTADDEPGLCNCYGNYYDCNGVCGGTAVFDECGVCDGPGIDEYYDCAGNCLSDVDGDLVCDENEIVGCQDSTACNYDETATDDDGSCTYADEYYDCDGVCLSDIDSDLVCDENEIAGCQDTTACK